MSTGSDLSWKNVLDKHFRSSMLNVHTGFPAVVESVNGDGTVNIKPSITTVLQDGVVKPYDTIPSARVGTLSTNNGNISIRLPLYVGDEVWVSVSERDISGIVESGSGNATSNNIVDRFDLADCLVFPIFNTSQTVLPLEADKLSLHNKDSVIIIGENNITMKSASVTIESDDVAIKGSSLTHNGINIGDTHTHLAGTYKVGSSPVTEISGVPIP